MKSKRIIIIEHSYHAIQRLTLLAMAATHPTPDIMVRESLVLMSIISAIFITFDE